MWSLLIQSSSSKLAGYQAVNKTYLLFFDQPFFCYEPHVLTNYVTKKEIQVFDEITGNMHVLEA